MPKRNDMFLKGKNIQRRKSRDGDTTSKDKYDDYVKQGEKSTERSNSAHEKHDAAAILRTPLSTTARSSSSSMAPWAST